MITTTPRPKTNTNVCILPYGTYHQVNLAVVIDGSGSIGYEDFELAKEFAKDTVAAFADKNLFENNGTASFVQFSDSADSGGPFFSQEDFDSYVDLQQQLNSSTIIPAGIEAGRGLLADAPEATATFMVVMTDGTIETGQDPTVRCDTVVEGVCDCGVQSIDTITTSRRCGFLFTLH